MSCGTGLHFVIHSASYLFRAEMNISSKKPLCFCFDQGVAQNKEVAVEIGLIVEEKPLLAFSAAALRHTVALNEEVDLSTLYDHWQRIHSPANTSTDESCMANFSHRRSLARGESVKENAYTLSVSGRFVEDSGIETHYQFCEASFGYQHGIPSHRRRRIKIS